jgi:hypothetical protein
MRQMSQVPAESKPCNSLAGKRILVVEGNGLIAIDNVSGFRRADAPRLVWLATGNSHDHSGHPGN